MPLFKKSKKSRKPSLHPMSLGIPTHVAVGALGINADLPSDTGSSEGLDETGARIVIRDHSRHTSRESTPAREDGVTSHRRDREQGASSSTERPGHITPDLYAAQSATSSRGPPERENQGTVAERQPEIPAERASERDQAVGDVHDPVQLGRPKVITERDWKDRAIGSASIALDIAKSVAEAFSPLKAALATVSTVYDQYKETTAVKGKIEVLSSRIAFLEKIFEQPTSDEAEKRRRKELLSNFKTTEAALQSLHQKSGLRRFTEHVQDMEDVSGLLEDLQEAINDYQMVQQMAVFEQGCKLMDAAETTILNNFRSAQGAEYRHGGRKGCLKGTRAAVLDEIELWTRGSDKLPVYWLNGLAGTGKSTIAQTIAERIFADGRLGASFFCSRDFEDRSSLQLVLPTLAVQLARKYPKFRSLFISLVQSDPGIAHESLYNQMDKLIARPLQESAISTVIIIDALDECKDEEPASAILSVLARFVPELPKVRFFLTGRPEPRIREGFRLPLLAQVTDIFVLHDVESNQVNNDIRRFFQTSFTELSRRRKYDDWPAKAQLDRLCERAAGLFVYAVATVKFIDNRNNDPRKRLDLLLRLPKNNSPEGKIKFNADKTLDSLYTSILQEAFGDDSPEDDHKVRSVLGAVVLAANPLSPSAISALLRLDLEDVTPLLSSVHSLLILHDEDPNHPVRPFHKSFPDFITDPARCTNPRFQIFPHHHLELLSNCFGLMSRSLQRNMCRIPDTFRNSEVDDLQSRVEQYINHALQYACKSWHRHLVKGPVDKEQEILSALHGFLEKKFLSWLEVLSVLGAVKNAIDALDVAVRWLEEPSMLSLTNDCFRFVTGFFEVISTSTPHIYHSALLLSPKESSVKTLYQPLVNPLAKIVQGLPTSWDPSIASKKFPGVQAIVWSPCSKLIAVWGGNSSVITVLDAVTLEQLYTTNPPEKETTWEYVMFSPDSRLLTGYSWWDNCLVSWDLQTGGLVSNISTVGTDQCSSMTYSKCGPLIGGLFGEMTIITYDVLSGKCTSSHSVDQPFVEIIWADDECLHFATLDSGSITLWQVGFTPNNPPTKVGSLSTPDNLPSDLALYPPLSLLAFILEGRVLVWDAKDHRVLLDSTYAANPRAISFSPDGHFLVCGTKSKEFHIWKQSSGGYLPHQKLISSIQWPTPLISPNEQLVISFGGELLQLWHIINSSTPPTSSTQNFQGTRNFHVEFSPDRSLVAVAGQLTNTVTVLDTESGSQHLVIDTDTEICGMKMAADRIIVIGDGKIITWKLPTGNYTPIVSMSIIDSIQTTPFKYSAPIRELYASISSDLDYVAFGNNISWKDLCIYSVHTGEKLTVAESNGWMTGFTPDEVWCASDNGKVDQWIVVERDGSKTFKLKQIGKMKEPSSGVPWHSSQGYRVTDNGWILSPEGKQLLWIPYHWLPDPDKKIQKLWCESFLAIWNRNLQEPVILNLKL